MEPEQPESARPPVSWREHFEQCPVSDEGSCSSSDPDFADSGDDADYTEERDLSCDSADEVEEEEMEECRDKRRGRRRRGRVRSESFHGNETGWKTEKDPDTMAQPPQRFIPKRQPGVQPPLSQCAENPSPSELFKMYFDRAAIKTLCANTNKNAAKNIAVGKKYKWVDVSEAEMYQYIGITLYMGILKLPKLKDFWRASSIFHVPYIQEVMPRDRFLAIASNIHMSDPGEDAFNDCKKGTDDYDCLHKIRPLYDSLRVACKAVYHPQQNLSVDERMVATKARIPLTQYMKNKPANGGIILFVLSDNTGYTVDFNISTGRSTQATGKRGLPFDAVMSLLNKNILGFGYRVYCDNFYTSPALFRHLHDLGFGACGTFRDSSVGVPKTKANALTKDSPRGTIRWIREGPLIFIKWKDTREVNVCSTLHTAYSGDTVRRAIKVGGKQKVVEMPVPSAVRDYNSFRGGVDLSDQLIGSYSSWRRSTKWYVTVLHHFIDIAVTNSYLLHKELCGRREQQQMTHQAFQEQLTAELCGVPAQPVPQSCPHIPVAIVEGATGSKKATQGRRKCGLCGKCTPFMCEACQVPLCVIVDRNCHKMYHSSPGNAEK